MQPDHQVNMAMTLEITEQERTLLLELIEYEQKRFIHELDHTDRRDYKALVKEKLRTLEQLLDKVQRRAAS
jgi:DNA-binding MarR family transcriptional regulator